MANAQPDAWQAMHITADDGTHPLLAQGCTFERAVQVTAAASKVRRERVLLVRMERLRQGQLAMLDERLTKATAQLLAVALAPRRG